MSCPMCNKNHTYTIDQALTSLATTGRRLERIVSGMSAKRAAARPAPDKWSAKEIICHLSDCELVYGYRFRKILCETEATLVAFDQEAWANKLRYRDLPLKSALATFKALRSGHIALLKSLPRSAWNKSGQHPSYGALTLRQIVTHLADHDRNHVAQVERLAAKSATKK
jgi:hypothetical protein